MRNNRRTIMRDRLVERVLIGLKERMVGKRCGAPTLR